MLPILRRDVAAALERDPAARSSLEVLLFYPGIHAIIGYRLAHQLWIAGYKLPARFVSALAYRWTGVDIHPGATIGPGIFIDHASGVVIGETAEVGENVTLYHQVTLGGRGDKVGKRHPNIGDRVVLGTGSKVLGPITVGADSRIGANAVVVRDVPPGSVVVGVPGQIVSAPTRSSTSLSPTQDILMPDTLGEGLKSLIQRVDEIETAMGGKITVGDVRPGADGTWSADDFSI